MNTFKSKGIEIKKNNVDITVSIFDILEEIPNPEHVFWTIRCLDIQGYHGDSSLLQEVKSGISEPLGHEISWPNLIDFCEGVDSFIWLILVGTENKEELRPYQSDLERYESSSYNIEVFDGWLWDVFSLNMQFIERLSEKFINTRPIYPDETADWQRY